MDGQCASLPSRNLPALLVDVVETGSWSEALKGLRQPPERECAVVLTIDDPLLSAGPSTGLGRSFDDIRLLCGFGIAFGHSSLETLLPVSTFCIIRSVARVVQLGSVYRPEFPAEGLKTRKCLNLFPKPCVRLHKNSLKKPSLQRKQKQAAKGRRAF